jgi:hypothetical protein
MEKMMTLQMRRSTCLRAYGAQLPYLQPNQPFPLPKRNKKSSDLLITLQSTEACAMLLGKFKEFTFGEITTAYMNLSLRILPAVAADLVVLLHRVLEILSINLNT